MRFAGYLRIVRCKGQTAVTLGYIELAASELSDSVSPSIPQLSQATDTLSTVRSRKSGVFESREIFPYFFLKI